MLVHVCGNRCVRGRGKGARGCPRAERTPPEGVLGPRARRTSFEGRAGPSSEADPARGGARDSSKADLGRGSVYPSSEADFTRGASAVLSWRAAGPPGLWLCCVRALGVQVDLRFAFFAGFKRVSPRSFRGPLGLSPTVAPEHLWVFPLGPADAGVC
jgi:hypothetical protein